MAEPRSSARALFDILIDLDRPRLQTSTLGFDDIWRSSRPFGNVLIAPTSLSLSNLVKLVPSVVQSMPVTAVPSLQFQVHDHSNNPLHYL